MVQSSSHRRLFELFEPYPREGSGSSSTYVHQNCSHDYLVGLQALTMIWLAIIAGERSGSPSTYVHQNCNQHCLVELPALTMIWSAIIAGENIYSWWKQSPWSSRLKSSAWNARGKILTRDIVFWQTRFLTGGGRGVEEGGEGDEVIEGGEWERIREINSAIEDAGQGSRDTVAWQTIPLAVVARELRWLGNHSWWYHDGDDQRLKPWHVHS